MKLVKTLIVKEVADVRKNTTNMKEKKKARFSECHIKRNKRISEMSIESMKGKKNVIENVQINSQEDVRIVRLKIYAETYKDTNET